MIQHELSANSCKALRIIALLLGGSAVLLALLAGKLGLAYSGHFGPGRVVLLSAGIISVLIGATVRMSHIHWLTVIYRKLMSPYQAVASMVLTSILVLLVLQVFAYLMQNKPWMLDPRASLPYYRSQDWATTYWREQYIAHSQTRYHEYTIWRTAPFKGQTINVDANGIRRTVGGADCPESSYEVFTFGGSTMFGGGSPDWGTISSYLQIDLVSMKGLASRPVCVTNFGENGWTSTQGVIMLQRQIQNGHIPDVVISYEGLNDTWFAYQGGRAGIHANADSVATRLEHPFLAGPWAATSFGTYLSPMLSAFIGGPTVRDTSDELASKVTRAYLANYSSVTAMASRYGFKSFFFLQPGLFIGQKVPTTDERQMLLTFNYSAPGFVDFLHRVYQDIQVQSAGEKNLHFLTHAFDADSRQIYIDVIHITPEGNQRIARLIADQLAPQLFK